MRVEPVEHDEGTPFGDPLRPGVVSRKGLHDRVQGQEQEQQPRERGRHELDAAEGLLCRLFGLLRPATPLAASTAHNASICQRRSDRPST